jgi:hypothetical protein
MRWWRTRRGVHHPCTGALEMACQPDVERDISLFRGRPMDVPPVQSYVCARRPILADENRSLQPALTFGFLHAFRTASGSLQSSGLRIWDTFKRPGSLHETETSLACSPGQRPATCGPSAPAITAVIGGHARCLMKLLRQPLNGSRRSARCCKPILTKRRSAHRQRLETW